MWHMAVSKRHPLRLKLTNYYTNWGAKVIYEASCFDVAHGHFRGATNETRTHSRRFGFFVFNGISTFAGYLMPKPFSFKNNRGTI